MTKLLVRILRIATMVFAFLFSAAITLGIVMEKYPAPLDAAFDTLSSEIVSEETDEADWIYQSKFKTAKEAFEGLKEFAIRESHETFALLKNEGNALPISKTAKITMMGLRSYAPVYGNSGGSIADKKTVETGNQIYKAFADNGFQLNPSMLKAYENYAATLTWGGKGFGATPPEYQGLAVTNDVPELSIAELASYNDAFDSEYDNYDDAAIIVVGRPGGESKNYYPGAEGLIEGLETTTGNILGLSTEEKEIIEEAKDNFDKVIVLVNSTMMMELGELEADPEIDAVMWIGYPGAYGFHGVADVLCGDKTPSAHLGDIYATNTAVAPAMMNFGNIPWANKSDFASGENVNGYLINAEGIYSGYRYYETRYADVVAGVSSAKTAKAGTYTGSDYKIATTDGVWDYAHEVVYPFGYGLSYTTFEQKLDSVEIMGDKRSAKVTVTVKNTGDTYSGKSVIQLYGQAPYEHGTTKVEKSAIQLLDFEKTKELKPGDSQTITMNVDLANIASYDSKDAKTFILDEGTYFMAIGDDSHDALNNILAAKGYDEADGMTEDGDKTKAYSWNWGYDADTFSVSYKGVEITNRLSDGIYSMDINTFLPGTVTYMTRSNFNGTFPKTYSGLTATGDLVPLLKNDFIQLKTDADTSKYQWGVKGDLTLNDMKGAEFNDPRWASLVDQVPIEEFLTFASKAFHNIQEIPSVQYMGHNADDGPGGSDNHYLEEGSYQGTPYADAEEYKGFGTRVAPTPTNLAYSWNKELAFENGEIILGESTLVLNLPIMIGPGMNMHRHAYNGRGGEYYSEDPILSGYIGSAVIQGAQSKGTLVNIKHAAFNDQEINRSGVAVFMTEQTARELELRNLQQAFVANGKPASFYNDESKADTYKIGALGVMTSYNRIGPIASSAHYGVMVDIMRNEWDFNGYNVTDFTSVSLKAAPKESLMAGTTAFCGMSRSVNFEYWNSKDLAGSAEILKKDATMAAALKDNIKYVLYSLANSAAVNGTNNTTRRVELMSTWRVMYISLRVVFGVLAGLSLIGYATLEVLNSRKDKKEA